MLLGRLVLQKSTNCDALLALTLMLCGYLPFNNNVKWVYCYLWNADEEKNIVNQFNNQFRNRTKDLN